MFKIGWAIIFQSEGLDVEGMKDYLSTASSGTVVNEVKEETLAMSDRETGEDEERSCTIFYLTTEGIMIPPTIKWALNLKETEQQYVYMPYER